LGGDRRKARNSERGREEEENWKNRLFWGSSYRGTVVDGNFGLKSQETARIPRARESERLFLVGWEVNIQFGQFGQ
jgi:hypothetical protein